MVDYLLVARQISSERKQSICQLWGIILQNESMIWQSSDLHLNSLTEQKPDLDEFSVFEDERRRKNDQVEVNYGQNNFKCFECTPKATRERSPYRISDLIGMLDSTAENRIYSEGFPCFVHASTLICRFLKRALPDLVRQMLAKSYNLSSIRGIHVPAMTARAIQL